MTKKKFRISWTEHVTVYDNDMEQTCSEDIEASNEKEALLLWAQDIVRIEEIREIPKGFKMLVEKDVQAFYSKYTKPDKDDFNFTVLETNKVRYDK